jgi:hypothetical protein
MKNGIVFILAMALAFPVATSAASGGGSFLCLADKSTGFTLDKRTKRWEPTVFNVSGEKFIVRHPSKEEQRRASSAQWIVVSVGDSPGQCRCASDFDEAKLLSCACEGGTFFLSSKTLRFLKSHEVGYWNSDPDTDQAFQESAKPPSLTIGKCSPL